MTGIGAIYVSLGGSLAVATNTSFWKDKSDKGRSTIALPTNAKNRSFVPGSQTNVQYFTNIRAHTCPSSHLACTDCMYLYDYYKCHIWRNDGGVIAKVVECLTEQKWRH